jgi:hypothetical protein
MKLQSRFGGIGGTFEVATYEYAHWNIHLILRTRNFPLLKWPRMSTLTETFSLRKSYATVQLKKPCMSTLTETNRQLQANRGIHVEVTTYE